MTGPDRVALTLRLARLHAGLGTRDRWSRAQLVTHQARALAELRAFASGRSRFYRLRHRGLEARPLADLPILTRADLLEHYDEIATDGAIRREDLEAFVATGGPGRYRGRYVVVTTSGSSGLPAPFAFDPVEWATVLASLGRGLEWAGLGAGLRHRRRIASVATTSPLHASCRASMSMPQWWLPSLRLDASAPIDELAPALEAWRPDLLVTYGSVVGRLAAAQLEGRLSIAPRTIMVGADRLGSTDRALAEAAWGRRVYEQYDATETAGIAAECAAHDGLHLFEDLAILEPVDGDGRPVGPGEAGERVLVTVLWGRTLPLIRYELNDVVRLETGPCACGRPFARIGELLGRAEEALELVGRGGERVVINAVAVHEAMDRALVGGWQLVQEADGLRLRLVGADEGGAAADGRPRAGADGGHVAGGAGTGGDRVGWAGADRAGGAGARAATAVAALEAMLHERGADRVPIIVEHVAAIDRGPTGKAPLVRGPRHG